jgi:hypothetical protein
VTFDDEGLPDVRKVEVVFELCGRPDFAGFNAAMIRRGVINEIRFLPVPEGELEVCKERGLVSVDGEVADGMNSSRSTDPVQRTSRLRQKGSEELPIGYAIGQ